MYILAIARYGRIQKGGIQGRGYLRSLAPSLLQLAACRIECLLLCTVGESLCNSFAIQETLCLTFSESMAHRSLDAF
jgi:hypothetical protein